MICGTSDVWIAPAVHRPGHRLRPGAKHFYAMNRSCFQAHGIICDTYVNLDPTAEQLAEMTRSPPRLSAASA